MIPQKFGLDLENDLIIDEENDKVAIFLKLLLANDANLYVKNTKIYTSKKLLILYK